jgi:hypothetical protein
MIKLVIIQFLTAIASSLWPHVDDEIIKRKRLAFMVFVFCVLGIVATFLLTGCAAVPAIQEVLRGTANEKIEAGPLYQFRAELEIEIMGKDFEGVTASTLQGPLDIKIKAKFPINRLQVTSCGRQEVFRNIDKKWWGKISDNMIYRYSPSAFEKEGPCPLYIEAFNKGGLVAWAMIVFRNVEDLQAHTICNGVDKLFQGHSICQTKHSLEQAIYFDVPIEKFRATELCGLVRISPTTFKFFPRFDEKMVCTASFYALKKWHSLTAIGYKRILVQSE